MATSYGNWGGTGNRTALITGSSSGLTGGTGGSGGLGNYAIPLLDGDFATGNITASAWSNSDTAGVLKFDFRAGNQMIIDAFKWYQSAAVTHGTWSFAGSNDDSTYTDLLVGLTLGDAVSSTKEYTFTNTTGYQYYKLYQTGGVTSNGCYIEEIEFKIQQAVGLGYDDIGGRGNRAAIIATSSSGLTGGCGSANFAAPLVDGSFVNGCSTSAAWGSSNTAGVLIFDFGAAPVVITEFLWSQDTASNHGTWAFAGSNDGVTYTDLETGIAMVTGSYKQSVHPITNNDPWRYYKLYQTGGVTSAASWNREIEFKIGAAAQGGNAPGSIISRRVALVNGIATGNPILSVAFTDDIPELTGELTIGAPAPYTVVALSDNVDDALTGVVTIDEHFVFRFDITDDSQIDAFSPIFPSIISQTILVSTGR